MGEEAYGARPLAVTLPSIPSLCTMCSILPRSRFVLSSPRLLRKYKFPAMLPSSSSERPPRNQLSLPRTRQFSLGSSHG